MRRRIAKWPAVIGLLGLALVAGGAAGADEMPPPPAANGEAGFFEDWQTGVTVYGWLPFFNGNVTARGREVKIKGSTFDAIELSDSFIGWMTYVETRKNKTALYADVFWAKIGFSQSIVEQGNPVPGLTVSVNADVGVSENILILEGGIAQEVARWDHGAAASESDARDSFTALDALGGVRYWELDTKINLDATITVDLALIGLTRTASGIVEARDRMDWTDPLVGLRLRHQMAPGQVFQLRGDIGGFGVGSDFSWQAIGAYSWSLGDTPDHNWRGAIGYRALSVDYATGSGNRRKGFDMVLHGPFLGASLKF